MEVSQQPQSEAAGGYEVNIADCPTELVGTVGLKQAIAEVFYGNKDDAKEGIAQVDVRFRLLPSPGGPVVEFVSVNLLGAESVEPKRPVLRLVK